MCDPWAPKMAVVQEKVIRAWAKAGGSMVRRERAQRILKLDSHIGVDGERQGRGPLPIWVLLAFLWRQDNSPCNLKSSNHIWLGQLEERKMHGTTWASPWKKRGLFLPPWPLLLESSQPNKIKTDQGISQKNKDEGRKYSSALEGVVCVVCVCMYTHAYAHTHELQLKKIKASLSLVFLVFFLFLSLPIVLLSSLFLSFLFSGLFLSGAFSERYWVKGVSSPTVVQVWRVRLHKPHTRLGLPLIPCLELLNLYTLVIIYSHGYIACIRL